MPIGKPMINFNKNDIRDTHGYYDDNGNDW